MMSLMLGAGYYGSAQTREQRAKIIKNYDQKKLSELKAAFEADYFSAKSEALAMAKIKGWPVTQRNADGSYAELQKISAEGEPLYYSTNNAGSAITSRTNKLHTGGSLGLNLNGQGMIAGVWDGGAVRGTHQDLTGRVIIKDGVPFSQTTAEASNHPTHVTGTIIGSGSGNAAAKGMAYQATAWTNDWNNDKAEATAEASQGLLISNHSYGIHASNQLPLYYYGAYMQEAKDWDNIMFNAPYYLMVSAAGNDRGQGFNPTKNQFDLLTGHAVSKNNIVVGAVNQVNNYTGANSVVISSFTSWGPADDGRIKPDLVTKGVGVLSTTSPANNSYGSMDGTSMASPGITGTLLLLQQHYNNLNNNFMKSATLKALAIHTADEAGLTDGPDYSFGWGLVNAERAAQVISNNGTTSIMAEHKLLNNQTFSTTVTSNGLEPLVATICWTDRGGFVNSGTVDLSTPALVNDLDIRVVQNGTVAMPWKLNPAAPSTAATKGDNLVDPVERVNINNAAGSYTITVSHKGTLSGGSQDFSLIVTGIGSRFNISSQEPVKKVCSVPTAVYTFNYLGGNADPTAITYSGLPANATLNLSQSTINATGTFTATIGNLANVLPGQYAINIIGTNGPESKSYTIELDVYQPTFTTPIVNTLPLDNAVNVDLYSELQWQRDSNAESYFVQIASDPAFTNIVESGTVLQPAFNPTISESNRTYYWRVKSLNFCGEGAYNTAFSYRTKNSICYNGENNTPQEIEIVPEFTVDSQITLTDNIAIEDLTVSVNITHESAGDLTLYLIGPGPNGARIKLIEEQCEGGQNIVARFDDHAAGLICNGTPVVSGRVKPIEPLSIFDGVNSAGVWTLEVFDRNLGSAGVLNSWSLEVCKQAPLGTDTYNLDSFSLWPNPAGSTANVKFNSESSGNINVSLFDLNGRTVQSEKFEGTGGLFTKSLNVENLASGVYIVKVSQGDRQSVARLIKK